MNHICHNTGDCYHMLCACQCLVVLHGNYTTDPCHPADKGMLLAFLQRVVWYFYRERRKGVFFFPPCTVSSIGSAERCSRQVRLHGTPTWLTHPLNDRVQVHAAMPGMCKSWADTHTRQARPPEADVLLSTAFLTTLRLWNPDRNRCFCLWNVRGRSRSLQISKHRVT